MSKLYPTKLYPYADSAITPGFYAGDRAWGDMQMVCNVRRTGRYLAAHYNTEVYAYNFLRRQGNSPFVCESCRLAAARLFARECRPCARPTCATYRSHDLPLGSGPARGL